MSRDVFHCQPGKAKDVVAMFKKFAAVLSQIGYAPTRIYTDVSGENYWTVVLEQDISDLNDLAEMSRKTLTDPGVKDILKGYHQLVQGGRRELYKLE